MRTTRRDCIPSGTLIYNQSLDTFNSLRVPSEAKEYVRVTTLEQLEEFSQYSGSIVILGHGTNIVLLTKVNGRVIHLDIQGINLQRISESQVRVRVGAGVLWHDLVRFTLSQSLSGLENLALIPGGVGAAPVQNIGAYGREISSVLESVNVFDLESGNRKIISNEECQFGYRTSKFRAQNPTLLVITHVNLRIGETPLVWDYRDVQQRLQTFSPQEIDSRLIAATVMRVRRHKLPDPKWHGNVGSFFKNPTMSHRQFDQLKSKIDTPGYEFNGLVRVPAARLIEACGWKGRSVGNVNVWHRQPLVLVNKGGAVSQEFLELASRIIDDVHRHYDVGLELEPIVVGSLDD